MSIPAKDRPDYRRPEVVDAAPDLQLLSDLIAGTRPMVAAAKTEGYIPQWPDEKDATYEKRIRSAPVYEGLGRTLSASTGMLFSTPPVLTFPTNEVALRADWNNIDGAGTKGDVFVKRFADSGLRDGHALILVDHPAAPEGNPVTAANEGELNLRPMWARYDRSAICSWQTATVNNELRYMQIVLAESGEAQAGAFGITASERYRVLKVVGGVARWELWEAVPTSETEKTFKMVKSGEFKNRNGKTRDTLPIAIAYVGRTDAPLTSRPPLLGVAWANLAHWRDATELRWGSRISAIEQMVVTGELSPTVNADGTTTPGKLRIGWEHGIHLLKDGTAQWVGPSGEGLNQLKTRMEEAEQQIAALGMSFLSRDKRVQETAEAKRLDATAENSTLATAAQGIEDAVNLAWEHHGWYQGVEKKDCPAVRINRAYDNVTIGAAEITAIAALVNAGMPVRQAVKVLAIGGVLVVEDEAAEDEIVLEWESGKAAQERVKQEQADRFDQAA